MPNAVVTGLILHLLKTGLFTSLDGNIRKEVVVFNTNTKRAASRRSKAFILHKVSRRYSKNCVGPIYSHFWRPKSNLDWNLVITLRSRLICPLTAQKSKCTHHFWEIKDPDILHTCWMYPCLPLTFFFVVLSLEMWDLLRPKYTKIYKKPKCMARSFFF